MFLYLFSLLTYLNPLFNFCDTLEKLIEIIKTDEKNVWLFILLFLMNKILYTAKRLRFLLAFVLKKFFFSISFSRYFWIVILGNILIIQSGFHYVFKIIHPWKSYSCKYNVVKNKSVISWENSNRKVLWILTNGHWNKLILFIVCRKKITSFIKGEKHKFYKKIVWKTLILSKDCKKKTGFAKRSQKNTNFAKRSQKNTNFA